MTIIQGFKNLKNIFESNRTLIYRGEREDNCPIILKILNLDTPTRENITAFKHEHQTLKEFKTDLIPKIYSLQKYKDAWIIEIEDIHGDTLEFYLKEKAFMVKEFLTLAFHITEAVKEVHKHGIIHKDINPANIIWNSKTNRINLIDFGISTQLSQQGVELKSVNALEGTLAFISPEQTGRMNRSIDQRSDLYSLGITFYVMLTQQLPFSSQDPLELVHQHIAKIPQTVDQLRPNIPKVICEIIAKLMAKNAEDRYQTADGLLYDLKHCIDTLTKDNQISSFKLGQGDLFNVFYIPQKLYGREAEVTTLLNLYDKVRHDKREIALISGYPGIGKSTLIHEIYKPIVASHGYFIEGKFDQYQRNLPALALAKMLQDFAKQILTEPLEKLAEWKDKIINAVGENAQILIDLAPDLQKVIGVQPPLVEVDSIAAENRFTYVISSMLKALPSKEHPFVLFWDDMQWADAISIKLLNVIFSQLQTGYLFLIFSFRDNEVSDTHPLKLLLNRYQSSMMMHAIKLNPLKLENVTELLADTLHLSHDQVTPLAQLCAKKTGSNPFFLTQFIQDLYRKGMIYCDRKEQIWKWNLTKINKEMLTNNVTDFLVSRLHELPEMSRKILSFASCISSQFNLETLAKLLHLSEVTTANLLEKALRDNYLIPINDNCHYAQEEEGTGAIYRFAHDKIREAAYSLLLGKEKEKMHLKIGILLLRKTQATNLDKNIIKIVDQLDHAESYFSKPKRKNTLAKLNFQAGKKAMSCQANEHAFYYFSKAINLITENDWQNDYNFVLELFNEAANTCNSLMNYEQLESIAEIIIKHARTSLDTVKIYKIKILSFFLRNLCHEAVEEGRLALKKLGYNLPKKISLLQMIFLIAEMKWLSKKVKIENIENLPVMTNNKIKALNEIITSMAMPSYYVDRRLYLFIVRFLFKCMLKYGITEYSPNTCLRYGMFLTYFLNDPYKGYEYANLSLNLMRQFSLKNVFGRILVLYIYFINYGPTSYKDNLRLTEDAYHHTVQVGDNEFALNALQMQVGLESYGGYPLEEILHNAEKADLFANQQKQSPITVVLHKINHQTVYNLLKKYDKPYLFHGPIFDERRRINKLEELQHKNSLAIIYFHKALIAFLIQEYSQAYGFIEDLMPIVKSIAYAFYYPRVLFLECLIRLNPGKKLSFWQKLRNQRRFKKAFRKIKFFAEFGPMNYLQCYYLISAEYARVNHKYQDAADYYEKAISTARDNDFINDEALAKELAARFYLDNNKESIAKLYLLQAYMGYKKWGAKVKIVQLEKQNPWLSKLINQGQSLTNIVSLIGTTTTNVKSQTLDYLSAMQASAAIASEIVLSKLIERLLKILTQNVAAERCVLLLLKNKNLFIEGEFTMEQGMVNLLKSLPLNHQMLPISIIQYVYTTHKNVVLDDASIAKEFLRDQYIISTQQKSILCVPILYRSRLLGSLYFENKLATGVFTAERLEFLKIVSSQVAVSVENAMLYHSFERFIPKQFLELLGKKELIDVRVGDSIQKNMTVLFTDIRNFTTLSEQQTAESVFKLLNEYLSQMEPIISQYKGFIDKYIGDSIMALFPRQITDGVNAAIRMQHVIEKFNQTHEKQLVSGLAIHSGLCMLGTLGSENRMDGSVISDVVNTASRIESLNKVYRTGFLISSDVKEQIDITHKYTIRFIDHVTLRGKSSQTSIWEVLDGLPLQIKLKKIKNLKTYNLALDLYGSEKYQDALKLFTRCYQLDPDDEILNIYIKRCKSKLTTVV